MNDHLCHACKDLTEHPSFFSVEFINNVSCKLVGIVPSSMIENIEYCMQHK